MRRDTVLLLFFLLFLGLRFRAVSFDTNTAIANYHSKMQQINVTDIKTGQLFCVCFAVLHSVGARSEKFGPSENGAGQVGSKVIPAPQKVNTKTGSECLCQDTLHSIQNFNYLLQFHLWNSPCPISFNLVLQQDNYGPHLTREPLSPLV